MIANGKGTWQQDAASQIADQARSINDNQTVQWAGKVWTIANSMGDVSSN